jgi:hypothetical protein
VGGAEGVCISSELLDAVIYCEALPILVCNRFSEDNTQISGVSVVDAPCFFNGDNDNSDMLCVSVSSIVGEDSCAVIQTNDIAVENSGNEKRYCDDSSSIFGFSFKCVWKDNEHREWGSCGSVYYIGNNGMCFFFF